MNYVVLDLEWNQCAEGKAYSCVDVPFEVVQIGAVKLNEHFNEVMQFDRYVKPAIYKKLHAKVEEILGITMEEIIAAGEDFDDVARDFLNWCGDDYIFCTWGGTDLVELQRNMNFYRVNYNFPKPFLFYDLQKLYSICFSDGKSRVTLQHAIEEQHLEELDNYHSAGADAKYAAMILKRLDFEKVKKYYSVDTYRIPDNKKEEIYLDFGGYGKYISRGFSSREKAAQDKEVRSCQCFICGKPMKKHIKWFATNAKSYYGLFECEEHGLIKGRFRIKSTDNERYYAVRILKLTDNEGAEKIRLKKQREQEHRRLLRHKLSEGEAEKPDRRAD